MANMLLVYVYNVCLLKRVNDAFLLLHAWVAQTGKNAPQFSKIHFNETC